MIKNQEAVILTMVQIQALYFRCSSEEEEEHLKDSLKMINNTKHFLGNKVDKSFLLELVEI